VGGVIPDDDVGPLRKLGIAEVFGQDTPQTTSWRGYEPGRQPGRGVTLDLDRIVRERAWISASGRHATPSYGRRRRPVLLPEAERASPEEREALVLLKPAARSGTPGTERLLPRESEREESPPDDLRTSLTSRASPCAEARAAAPSRPHTPYGQISLHDAH